MPKTAWFVGFVLLTGCQRMVVTGNSVITDARVMKEQVKSQSFATNSTPQAEIELFAGAITVVQGDDSKLDAEVTMRGGGETEEEAAAMLKKIHLKMSADGDKVRITATTPSNERFVGEAPTKLKVPAGATVKLRSSFGDVSVTGVNGSITANSSNGSLIIREATGNLTLNTSFGKIDVDAAASNVDAKTSNGEIRVKQAKGPLTLKTSFGSIHVETPGGEVDAETSNGKIYVRGATRKLFAVTSFGDLDLEGDDVRLHAKTSNGSIKFVGKLADGISNIENSFGGISVALPADARFLLDAHTTFGRIETEFHLTEANTRTANILSGSVGKSPNVELFVKTSNGDIAVNPSR